MSQACSSRKGAGTADPNSLSPVCETDTGLCENTTQESHSIILDILVLFYAQQM